MAAHRKSLGRQISLSIAAVSAVILIIAVAMAIALVSSYVNSRFRERETEYIHERVERDRTVFRTIRSSHLAAQSLFDRYYREFAPEDVEARFAEGWDQADDGTYRLKDKYYEGFGATDGRLIYGLASYVPAGDLTPERMRGLVSALTAIQTVGPSYAHELESLAFFSPQNDIVIFAPTREDRLMFYRKTAPPHLDFQSLEMARLVSPESNPDALTRCTRLTNAIWDPHGMALTTGCQTPVKIEGRHQGGWSTTLPLNQRVGDLLKTGDKARTVIILSANGDLIATPQIGLAGTVQGDAVVSQARKYGTDRLMAGIRAADAQSGMLKASIDGKLVSFARLPEPDWIIIHLIEDKALLADMQVAIIGIIVLLVILLFSQAAFTALVMRHRVINPLKVLTRIHQGGRDEDVAETANRLLLRGDEIGELSRGLSQAHDRNRDLIDSLEERVAQRTAELDQRRNEAEAATLAKTRFLANMSHEIRTPMNGVLGMASALARTPLDADQSTMLDVMLKSGNALMNIIGDILDLSKIEAGKLEMVREPFNMKLLLASVYDFHRLKADEKGLRLEFDIAPDGSGGFIGDPQRMRQILDNLLSNALKFTEKGEVRVSLSREDAAETGRAGLRLIVEDTGIGITDDSLAALFQPFTQSEDDRLLRKGGTGLGLTICRQLCQMMGGDISVESRRGKGSRFECHIVLEVDESVCASAEDIEDAPAIPTNIQRVLVAEDHPTNRLVIATILQPFGLDIVFVETGREAVDVFSRQDAFDLVLMDIQMPEMDGVTATRLIRSIEIDRGLAPTPIVGVSAHAMSHQVEEFMLAGMNSYISKPFTVEQLLVGMCAPPLSRAA